MLKSSHTKIILLALLISPWITVPLLGKDTIRRFLPATIFILLVVRLESMIAKRRKWWWFYEKLHPKLGGEFPLLWGPFLIGAMWILKYTFGRFYTYLVTNLIVDGIFTFPLMSLFKNLGIGGLVRLEKYQLSLLFFIKSLLLYGSQLIIDKIRKSNLGV
ncbi:hypothetical protein ACFYKX_19720 [Cytobacillus sp. FJAT-54145]|uniref:Uncharacterized protein n=1 Tax=Cytobacillus spartinae TaxID=3299023 RepID=A0ABW6KF88_9BACI